LEEGLIAYTYSGYTALKKNINIPNENILHQNYPKLFIPSTTIDFSLPKSDFVELRVFNILGKEISKWYQEN